MSGNVGIFVDLILLALLLIGLVLGWRQGFVQALTRIIVVVAALLLASWIAGKLAEPAARWLEPILSEKLEQRLTAQGNTDDAGEMLAAFGFEGDTLSELVKCVTVLTTDSSGANLDDVNIEISFIVFPSNITMKSYPPDIR